MTYPFAHIPDIVGIALISSMVLSVIVIALTIKILMLTDVSKPWKLAGAGFIVSMIAVMVMVLNLFQGGLNVYHFLLFFFYYLTAGILLYTSLRQLEITSRDPSSMGLG